MEIQTEAAMPINAARKTPYEVGRSDILPTIRGSQLAISFIKEIVSGKTGGMFSAGPANKIAVMTFDGSGIRYTPTALQTSETSDEDALLVIDGLTEGMKASAKEKVAATIMRSKGMVANAEDEADAEGYFTDADIEQIKQVHKEMFDQLEEMKKVPDVSGNKAEHYMFRKHILLQGQKGQGKTYQVDKLLRDKGVNVEYIAGHEGIEAIDLQGYLIKDDTGNLIWKDGVITAAFRKATMGERTAIFIDEMLRIPKRELNFLVGILTPDSTGHFNMRTGRVSHTVKHVGIDGNEHEVAEEEILRVKADMIWAVGTTNAGAGYAVDSIDEALADRFRTIIITMSEKDMQKILADKLKEKGFSTTYAKRLMEFYKNFNMLRDSGELTKTTSIRHLVETIELSDDEDMISYMLMDFIPTLCEQDTNGNPNESQEAIIEELIEKSVG